MTILDDLNALFDLVPHVRRWSDQSPLAGLLSQGYSHGLVTENEVREWPRKLESTCHNVEYHDFMKKLREAFQ